MFDIGFWELALIGLIALLVFGPERLPEVARTAGLWVSRIRRFVANVKRDVEQEIRAEELKQILKQPNPLSEVHEILEETRRSLEKPVTTTADSPPAAASLRSEAQSESPGLEAKPEDPSRQPKPETTRDPVSSHDKQAARH